MEKIEEQLNNVNGDISKKSLKSRITALSKLDNAQLMNIILRKDDTERKNNKKISILKDDCNALIKSNQNLKKDLIDTNDNLFDINRKLDCANYKIHNQDTIIDKLHDKLSKSYIFNAINVLIIIILLIVLLFMI